MKKIIILSALLTSSLFANAQVFDFSSNNGRIEAGFCAGLAGYGTKYQGLGSGACASIFGGYLDYIQYGPQHRYSSVITDEDWDDSVALSINLGYQIPVLPWLRVMPLVGYTQTNEGKTKGNEMDYDSDETFSWYHPYKVTKGSRIHRFNYGGGISIQPVKWFSLSFMYTHDAIYGGISINLTAFAQTTD